MSLTRQPNSLCLILVTFLSNIGWAERYTSESWVYASVLDGTCGYPFSNIGVGRIAIGLSSPPLGIGAGIAIYDGFVAPGPEGGVVMNFPVSLYYLPFTKWKSNGLAFPVVYLSFTTNFLPVNYHFLMVRSGITFFCAGIELGMFVSFRDFTLGGFHGGIKLSLGGWFGSGVKKTGGEE